MQPIRTARLGTGLLAALAVLAAGDHARGQDGEKAFQAALKASVCIHFDSGGEMAFATGTLIDANRRYVLTSNLVATRSHTCFALFPVYENGALVGKRDTYLKLMQEGKCLRAKVVVQDKRRGVAILELDKLPGDARALPLAARSPRPGAAVHSVGNPDASDSLWGYTPGEVRQVYPRRIAISRGEVLNCTVIETTSAINYGDIGGPLLNDKAELVGVSLGFLGGGARNVSAFLDLSEIKTALREKNIVIGEAYISTTGGKETGKYELKTAPGDDRGGKANPDVAPKKETPKEAPKDSPEESKAQIQLTLAKGLAEAGRNESALRRLEELIKNFPKTKAAREAKDLIDQLKKQN